MCAFQAGTFTTISSRDQEIRSETIATQETVSNATEKTPSIEKTGQELLAKRGRFGREQRRYRGLYWLGFPQRSHSEPSVAARSSISGSMRSRGVTAPTRSSTQVSQRLITLFDTSKPSSSVAISAASEAGIWEMSERVEFQEPDQQAHWNVHHSVLKERLQKYEAAEKELITAPNTPMGVSVRNDGGRGTGISEATMKLMWNAINAYTGLAGAILAVRVCGGQPCLNIIRHKSCLSIGSEAFQEIMLDKAKLWTGYAEYIRRARLLPNCALMGASNAVQADPKDPLGIRYIRKNPTNGKLEAVSTMPAKQHDRGFAASNHGEPYDPTDS